MKSNHIHNMKYILTSLVSLATLAIIGCSRSISHDSDTPTIDTYSRPYVFDEIEFNDPRIYEMIDLVIRSEKECYYYSNNLIYSVSFTENHDKTNVHIRTTGAVIDMGWQDIIYGMVHASEHIIYVISRGSYDKHSHITGGSIQGMILNYSHNRYDDNFAIFIYPEFYFSEWIFVIDDDSVALESRREHKCYQDN